MPDTTTTISGEARDAIYELVRTRLGGLDDVLLSLGKEDFATAKRLGREFAGDLRLLDDLGWRQDDEREAVELTMPPDELAAVLRRLHEAATACLTDPIVREEKEAEEQYKRRCWLAQGTCAKLLVALHEQQAGSA